MKVVLKTQRGYLNTDNGIEIHKNKEEATVFEMSKAFDKKEEIYMKKPMIGKISIEKC